jgi:protein gp37
MAKHSPITWCHHTHNWWWGCVEVDPACDHCYARIFDHRLGGSHWGKDAPRRFFGDAHWDEPLKWAKNAGKRGVRERVFVNSMSDVFEDRRDLDEHRARGWKLIEATPELDWLLLTKRPDVMRRRWPWASPPPNVWAGTTIALEAGAWRADKLRQVPARVRFISYEPALGPIDSIDLTGIDWIVCGDEDGQQRRPADPQWFRDLRDKCEREGVAFHMKQWAGADTPGITGVRGGKSGTGKIHLPVLDGRQHGAFPEVTSG